MSAPRQPGLSDADRALDELLDAASGAPDDEPQHHADFAAVLARAHRIDPTAMPARPPGDGSLRGANVAADVDRVLAGLVDSARAEAEGDVAAAAMRRDRAAPSIRSPRTLRTATAALAVLAAAAAVVLAFGVIEIGQLARRDSTVDGKSQSAAQLDADQDLRATQESTGADPVPPRPGTSRRRSVDAPAASAADAAPIPDEPVPLEPLADTPPPQILVPTAATPQAAPVTAAPSRPRIDPDERLRKLDHQAQRQLAAGESRAAAATLREIVRRAGRTAIAQLAYGDLFTLAHQSGDERTQRALWRDYLRKFPRGRFADDARAGLCRHAPPGERQACWTSYLSDFPRGAYRDQASRAKGDP